MTIKIDTKAYYMKNGHHPKGSEYGIWTFNLGRDGAWTEFHTNGSFASASKAAKAEAKSLGCTMIVIA